MRCSASSRMSLSFMMLAKMYRSESRDRSEILMPSPVILLYSVHLLIRLMKAQIWKVNPHRLGSWQYIPSRFIFLSSPTFCHSVKGSSRMVSSGKFQRIILRMVDLPLPMFPSIEMNLGLSFKLFGGMLGYQINYSIPSFKLNGNTFSGESPFLQAAPRQPPWQYRQKGSSSSPPKQRPYPSQTFHSRHPRHPRYLDIPNIPDILDIPDIQTSQTYRHPQHPQISQTPCNPSHIQDSSSLFREIESFEGLDLLKCILMGLLDVLGLQFIKEVADVEVFGGEFLLVVLVGAVQLNDDLVVDVEDLRVVVHLAAGPGDQVELAEGLLEVRVLHLQTHPVLLPLLVHQVALREGVQVDQWPSRVHLQQRFYCLDVGFSEELFRHTFRLNYQFSSHQLFQPVSSSLCYPFRGA